MVIYVITERSYFDFLGFLGNGRNFQAMFFAWSTKNFSNFLK